jgi:hypothetical protein
VPPDQAVPETLGTLGAAELLEKLSKALVMFKVS